MHKGPLSGVTRFGQLVATLENSSISAAQKAHYLVTASHVCDGRGDLLIPRRSSSTKTYFHFIEGFCADRRGDTQGYVNQAAKHPESDVAISKEMAASAPLPRDLAIEAQKIVLTSMDPDAIRNAEEALVSSKWAFPVDSAGQASSLSMLPQAQAIASHRVACDISGGCGPGELFSMIECSGRGVCRKNISFNEALEASFSTDQLDIADNVYLDLTSARNIEASKSLR